MVAGSFDRKGEALVNLSLTGVLDARSASSLGGRTTRASAATWWGARCERCADAVAACVTVESRGVSGSRLSW